MTRDNLLFAIIGILLGFICGFILASSMSQKMVQSTAGGSASSQALPPDHPPIAGNQTSANPGGGMQAEVSSALEKAKNEPKNFDAQVKAAELYNQIGRYDQAIEYLTKANQLKPNDYDTIVSLGIANLDAGHYDVAEKWYRVALKTKSDDVRVLAGMSYSTLQRGDVKAAEDAIAKLEKADPNSEDLPQFKEKLASLKTGK